MRAEVMAVLRPKNWLCAQLVLLLLFFCSAAHTQAHRPIPQKQADLIVIVKSTRTMTLYRGRSVLKIYKVALSADPVGPKTREGDHKVPEGDYVIDGKIAHSQFHRALHLSYPNAQDRARARRLGVNPGGDVEIHGLPNGYAWIGSGQHMIDWTDGCIAVTDAEIDEIWQLVPVGTRVEIKS